MSFFPSSGPGSQSDESHRKVKLTCGMCTGWFIEVDPRFKDYILELEAEHFAMHVADMCDDSEAGALCEDCRVIGEHRPCFGADCQCPCSSQPSRKDTA